VPARYLPQAAACPYTVESGGARPLTIDEELTHLDSLLRRLKIEYEVYFDGGRMNFTQRFRYNEMAQRYAIYSDLWRKKMRIREEGYRRPQDALLSVQGVRVPEEHEPKHHQAYGVGHTAEPRAFTLECSDKAAKEDVERLYNALVAAKKKSGEEVTGNLDSFSTFVKKKTDQIRKQYGCEVVQYSVELQDGQVKLKAKAKT